MPRSAPRAKWSPGVLGLTLVLLGCGGGEPSGAAGSEGSESGEPPPLFDDESGPPPTLCTPGELQPCYEGPFGTADIGVCRSGQQTCADDGRSWLACAGEVWPQPAEDCHTAEDDDCDGSIRCHPVLEWAVGVPEPIERMDASPDGGLVGWGQIGGEVGFFGGLVISLDAQGQVRWQQDVSDDEVHDITDVVVDARGQTTMVGRYTGQPDFGGGPLPGALGYDSLVVRYDAQGQLLWSHTLSPSGYYDAAVGPDGTTFVAGKAITTQVDGETINGDFFVAAIDATGQLAWVTTGSGVNLPFGDELELVTTGENEVVAMITLATSPMFEFGGVSVGELGYGPILLRLSAQGELLGHTPVIEDPTISSGEFRAHPSPDGLRTVTSVSVPDEDQNFTSYLLLAGFDGMLHRQPEHLVGSDLWLRAAGRYPPGGTVFAVSFSGQLQLGEINVSGSAASQGQAVTVVDEQGQARWVELLQGDSYHDLRTVAGAEDGSVLVAGDVGGGATFAGELLMGPFVAKLRP